MNAGAPVARDVTVIVPAYNAAATLAAALRSVAAQTVRAREVLVVDDGSQDDTVGVAERELAGLPHGRCLRLGRNCGPAAARNAALAEARGAWLAFLDADDAWLPWRLERQWSRAEMAADVALWCGRTVPLAGDVVSAAVDGLPAVGSVLTRRLCLEEFAEHNPVATSTVLVRTAAVASVGGFDPAFRGPEDYELWMRLVARHSACYADEPLAAYRNRAGSLSMDERRFLPEVLRVLEKAFGPGGVLAERQDLRRRAVANQFWNPSWMAFNRGARSAALRHYVRAVLADRRVGGARKLALLWRYLVGRPDEEGRAKEVS